MITLLNRSQRTSLNRGGGGVEKRSGRTAIAAFSDTDRERGLTDWIVSNGGSVGPVEICRSEQQGWFLQSSSDIYPGAELVSLPAECQLTYDALSDPELMPVIGNVPEEFWSGRLSLKLLVERLRGEQSNYWPYLQCVPQGVPGVPIFYSESAIQSLEYPPLIEQVITQAASCYSHGDLIFRSALSWLAGNSETVPEINLMGWALAIVSSRAFRVYGPSRAASMLPLIDLCNHSFSPNSEVKPSTAVQGAVSLISSHTIQKGVPVLINYGELPNDDLLLDYGFIVKENPHDYVELRFDPDSIRAALDFAKTTPEQPSATESPLELRKWQDEMLRALQLSGPECNPAVRVGSGKDGIDPRFLAGVRVLAAPAILKGISLEQLGKYESTLEPALDIKALRTIATTMVAALSRFSNDVHTDRESLTAVSDPNERLAIAFRIEKKQLLLDAIRHIATCIRALTP